MSVCDTDDSEKSLKRRIAHFYSVIAHVPAVLLLKTLDITHFIHLLTYRRDNGVIKNFYSLQTYL